MKKTVALICILLMIVCAVSEIKKPTDKMFETAKNATVCFAGGEYDKGLGIAGFSMSADECRKAFSVIDRLGKGFVAQTTVSVAWQLSGTWYISVPIAAPQDNMVPAVVFAFSNESAVSNISVSAWKDVIISCNQAENIIWNEAYNPSFIVIAD